MTSPQNLVKNVMCPDALWAEKRWWGRVQGFGAGHRSALASTVRWCTACPATTRPCLPPCMICPARAIEPLPSTLTTAMVGQRVGDACYDILIHNTGGLPRGRWPMPIPMIWMRPSAAMFVRPMC